jgi:sporulation protein YqfC
MSKKKDSKSNKNENEKHKVSLKERFTELLELPKEIVLNIPKLTMVGNGDMIIENYKSLIEYESERIRLNTGIGVVRITGSRLLIREITSEDIIICGEIQTLEFIK